MAERIPPTQALRAFEAVARTGSVTRAAQALNLTHGAVSHQVKALEDDLGVALMERSGRGIRLTDEGERLAQRIRAALAEISDALREVAQRDNPRQLRMTVMPSFAARWLLPRIGRFMAAHPDIDVDINSTNVLVDFAQENVDVGIRHGIGGWPELEAERVMDDAFVAVCSPHLAHGKLPKRPAELAKHVLLRSEGEAWAPWFKAAGLNWKEPQRGPKFSDSSHVVQAAIDAQGIALARTSLVGEELRSGRLVRLFDIAVPSPKSYFLVYPPRLRDAPKVQRFRAWLLDEIAREQPIAA